MNLPFIHSKKMKQKGMTSIELIVVIGIFGIIASTLLFRFSRFSDNTNLDNLAQEIALRVKQAQTNAISGQYPKLITGQTPPPFDWTPSYGVYFDKTGTNNKQFVFFYDSNTIATPGNRIIDDVTPGTNCGASGSECLDVITIKTSEYISDICVGGTCGEDNIAVSFRRPFPDATAIYNIGTTNDVATSDVKIKIKNTNAEVGTKVITITPLGQISISNDVAGTTTGVIYDGTAGTGIFE